MAPIIVANSSTDEDEFLSGDLKEISLNICRPDAPASGVVVLQRRDDVESGDAAADAEPKDGDGEPIDETNDSDPERRQSNLFVDENKVLGFGIIDKFPSIQTSYFGRDENNEVHEPPPDSLFMPQLSLMPSFSPTSSAPPSTVGSLEGEETGALAFFDETKWIQSQIDADEELARQLQEEENSRNPKPPISKPKVNVVPSVVDSLFGEPSPFEVKSNYSKVDNSSSSADFSDSISGGISMLASSFRKWGNTVTAAATDFFGEDIGMQVRSDRARGSGGQYRNAV